MTYNLICPKCGKEAKRTLTRYGFRNSCCEFVSWGSKELVDIETRLARIVAHQAFDYLWKYNNISRSKAYRVLAHKMKLPQDKCHMSIMDKETARTIPTIVKQIKEDYGFTN